MEGEDNDVGNDIPSKYKAMDANIVGSAESGSQQPGNQRDSTGEDGPSLSEAPQLDPNEETLHKSTPVDQCEPASTEKASLTDLTSTSDENRMWMYMDGVSPTQHGPFSEAIMLQLLRTGTAHKDMLAWSQGMGEWQPLGQIEAFRETGELATTPWLYLGENSDQQGPVSAAALSQLLRRGDVDGMTMAWTTGMTEWKPLGEVSQLRVLLQDDDNDDDDDSREHLEKENGAAGIGGGNEAHPEAMIFEGEVESQPAYEPPPKKEKKRSFMADDGTKFAWDEEGGGWQEVEGDEEDELEEEEEEEVEPSWKARRAKAKAKAKMGRSEAGQGTNGNTMDKLEDPDTEHWGELLGDAKGEGEAASVSPGAGGSGEESPAQKKVKKKKKKKGNQWNKKALNLWVYVRGLPSNVTMEEIREHFGKCGIIATDPLTQQPKIKLYRDEEGQLKGDGSVCYVKAESVEMATNVLHEGQIRPGVTIEVSRAVFQQKGDSFDTSKRLKVTDARVKVAKAAAQQALSWTESDDTGASKGGLKIVVVENMFQPSDFETNEAFGEELEADILAEGEKLGPVEKITVFPKNFKGPVVIKFGTAYAASECVKVFDGRFFGGKKLSCHFWDGVTNYSIKEDEKDEEQRLDAFGDWLEEQELPEELRPRTEA